MSGVTAGLLPLLRHAAMPVLLPLHSCVFIEPACQLPACNTNSPALCLCSLRQVALNVVTAQVSVA